MAIESPAGKEVDGGADKKPPARRRRKKTVKRGNKTDDVGSAQQPATEPVALGVAPDGVVSQLDAADLQRSPGAIEGEAQEQSSGRSRRRRAPRSRRRPADAAEATSNADAQTPEVAAPSSPDSIQAGDSPAGTGNLQSRRSGGRGSGRRRQAKSGKNKDDDRQRQQETQPAGTPTSGARSEGATTPSSDPTDRAKARPSSGGRRRRSGAKKPSDAATADLSATKAATEAPGQHTTAADQTEKIKRTLEPGGGREMVINVTSGVECRIAILHERRLEELFIERASSQSHVGNIYKGRVTNVEPSIQAVFVDFGTPKNGFLHISDVQPQYFPDHKGESEDVGRKIPRHSRPLIQKCFRRGQEVIVQITKEGVGTKGPTLTTYLSMPGRFLVMMPGMSRHGVSRKIEDEAERREMRDLLKQLNLPEGMGFIVRTAGLDRSKRELQRDLNYLDRLWKTVVKRVKNLPAPAELYEESDLVTRTIRDVYTPDFERIIVDDPDTAKTASEFLQIAMPRAKAKLELYTDREPLFHRFGIEEEIERINTRHVPLPSGASLVFDSTEALVAIDVNSGRFRSVDNAEESAFKINLEAAEEIARQLRLRDLGGLIVCDFIDMRLDAHKREVERALRDGLKKHKERARILRMSGFGLIEMTRQRQRPSVKRNLYFDCTHCNGSGLVKMPESVILDVMRFIQLAVHHEQVQQVSIRVASDVAFQLLNSKRAALGQVETETGKTVLVRGEASFRSDQVEYACSDSRGQPVPIDLIT